MARCERIISEDVTYTRCVLDAGHKIPCVPEADWQAVLSSRITDLLHDWAFIPDDPEDTRILPWAKRAETLLRSLING